GGFDVRPAAWRKHIHVRRHVYVRMLERNAEDLLDERITTMPQDDLKFRVAGCEAINVKRIGHPDIRTCIRPAHDAHWNLEFKAFFINRKEALIVGPDAQGATR